jgi:hypothetical protein
MARSIGDTLEQARIILQDKRVPYRYETDELYVYLNNSFTEIKRLRPDIFVGRFENELPKYSEGDESKTYPLADMYFPATVTYMVAMAETRDDQSIATGRAATFLQLFTAQLR